MSESQSKGSMNHNARVRSLSQSKIERMTEKDNKIKESQNEKENCRKIVQKNKNSGFLLIGTAYRKKYFKYFE